VRTGRVIGGQADQRMVSNGQHCVELLQSLPGLMHERGPVQVTKTRCEICLPAPPVGCLNAHWRKEGLLRHYRLQVGSSRLTPGHDYTDRDCWAIRRVQAAPGAKTVLMRARTLW